MAFTDYREIVIAPGAIAPAEYLKIKRSEGEISAAIIGYSYRDNETKQYICYLPSLEISGYGKTLEKAEELVKASMDDMFSYLLNLGLLEMNQELKGLGWIKNPIFTKEFSKVLVDENGVLQGLNAENGEIKRFELVAAA